MAVKPNLLTTKNLDNDTSTLFINRTKNGLAATGLLPFDPVSDKNPRSYPCSTASLCVGRPDGKPEPITILCFQSFIKAYHVLLPVHNTYKRLLLFLVIFSSRVATAQIVEQPDPLRPSTPDSTAADSTATTPGSTLPKPTTPQRIVRYRLAADGTVTAGNINRTLLQLAGSVDYELSNLFKLSSNPSFVYGRQSGILAEREWFGDFRTTYRPEKRLYYLGFGSFERSNLRKIDRRWTVAAGAGYKLLNRKRAYISLTNVLLNEYTDFVELNDINIYRNSTRLFGEYTFDNDRWTVTHTAFYQPALGVPNIRWNASLSVQVKLTAVVSLRTTLANAYESVVVPGRQNNDLRFTAGLVYERK